MVNPSFWPNFPWTELTSYYEAFLPMAYWTIRRGEYRNGERYIGENIDRIRHNTGRADLPIHPIGGIADGATVADLEGMIRAWVGRGASAEASTTGRRPTPISGGRCNPSRREPIAVRGAL